MPDHTQRPDFDAVLEREVARILADPAFQRSPIQSRLLAYLCEQTIRRNHNISQLAVAVDGLGRPETAAQLTESYPRVQISRLRQSLSLYYSRCAPGEGQAVHIRRGSYQLRLAPVEKAYPGRRAKGPAAPAVNDEAPAEPPDAAPQMGLRDRGVPTPAPYRPSVVALAGVAMLVIAVAAVAALLKWEKDRGLASPTVAFERADTAAGSQAAIALREAQGYAANSFVVTPAAAGQADGSRYLLRIQPEVSGLGGSRIALLLLDGERDLVFRDVVAIDEAEPGYAARLDGRLANIFGPTGIIATREARNRSDPPKSGYECMLGIEFDRGHGKDVTGRARACLEKFPDSRYRGYWLARGAFNRYRQAVLEGGIAAPQGPAWQDLQQALALEPDNPLANFVAAKVHIAAGNCNAARPYIERTVSNGNFYPALVAGAEAESGLCDQEPARQKAIADAIAEIVAATPQPDPLLRIYLIFASTALDRSDLARSLLVFSDGSDSEIAGAEPLAALRDGLASAEAFERNRARLKRVVDSFFWSEQVQDRLMAKLAAVANS